ncbi:MAG: alpha/beta hydrolase [Planctomycetaceae bacterium]|nr:alpha/beta hydrolase [Planctomycetaceae bacterium]
MSFAADDWRSLYPFCSHHLELDSLRLHYLDEGKGDPLLMVHGNPTWSFYWRNLVLAFRGKYRVVVPDHIGCGLSDKPQRYSYRLQQHITNLVRLIDELDLSNLTLLGHDWGGAIGLGAALQRPERVARIVLFNTGAFRPHFVPFCIRICRTPILGTIGLRGLNLFSRAAITMAVAKRDRMTPAVRSGLLVPYDSWANRVGVHGFVGDIPFTKRHPTWDTLADIENQLPTLADRPIQLIWGMQDWCFDENCLQRFKQIFPEAETHRLDDAGHYVVEDAYDKIVPLVTSFLESTNFVAKGVDE